jgi:hypothetical protein
LVFGIERAFAAQGRQEAPQPMANRRARLGEWAFIALTLALAAAGRLVLAARGWPNFNSDDSIVGLMTNDIMRHGAHPVFFYGQNYMGALQAYLAVPFFLLLGATPFALLVTATAETILFFLILYLFTREVFSRAVALCTLLLLAAGPFSALGAELHVGAGEHDTLLGALTLWLVTLRLRGRSGLRARLALDAGAGLVIGVALWSDFLILPFALAALLALMSRAAWRVFVSRERALVLRLGTEAGVAALFFLIGLAPLLLANVASQGATFREVFGATNSPNVQFSPSLPPGLAGVVQALYLQIAATLLVGLPHEMGSNVVCGPCAIWPLATDGMPMNTLLWTALVTVAFTLFVMLCWALAAFPLARNVLRDTRRILAAWRRGPDAQMALRASGGRHDARWWGRAMLVLGGLGTVTQYALTHVSYIYPEGVSQLGGKGSMLLNRGLSPWPEASYVSSRSSATPSQSQSVRSAFTTACANRSRPLGTGFNPDPSPEYDGWMLQVSGEGFVTMSNPAAQESPPKPLVAFLNAPKPSATIPPQASVRSATTLFTRAMMLVPSGSA